MPFLGTTGGGSLKQFGGQANLGYFIKNSLRTRSSASAYLNRTSGTPTSGSIFTHSFWVKRGTLGVNQSLIAGARPTNFDRIYFETGDTLFYQWNDGASNLAYVQTTQVFRDPSAWYHIVATTDTTQATASNRVKIYINGVQVTALTETTYPTQNSTSYFNTNAVTLNIGRSTNASMYFDGYMGEINFIDGQALTPSSFGKTDAVTGQWIPKKFAGTYGTNGFYLKFADASAATAAAIGKDSSPNGNNWTPNNISVTAGSTYDAMIDSPSLSGAASNYCTLNPLAKGAQFTVVDGNLSTGTVNVGNYHQSIGSTLGVNSGSWYWEVTIPTGMTTWNSRSIGIALGQGLSSPTTDNAMWDSPNVSALRDYRAILFLTSTTVRPCSSIAGSVQSNGTTITLPSTAAADGVFMVALNITAGAIWFGLNGTWLKSATTAEIVAGTTSNAVFSNLNSSTTTDYWFAAFYNYLGASSGYGWAPNFGQRPFSYTPPSGYKSLNTFNLP